jgi:hypothetical protein
MNFIGPFRRFHVEIATVRIMFMPGPVALEILNLRIVTRQPEFLQLLQPLTPAR